MTIYSPPATIDNTGVKDVSYELNEWLCHDVPNGTGELNGTTTVVFDGTYRVNDGLAIGSINSPYNHPHLPDHRKEHIDFIGGIFTYDDLTLSAQREWGMRFVHFLDAKHIVMKGMNFEGPLTQAKYVVARESWHGFLLSGGSNISIGNCFMSGIPGDFVYMTPRVDYKAHTVTQVTDVSIVDNSFSVCGRQAFTVNSGVGVSIVRNHVDRAKRMILDCEPFGNSVIDRFVFADNVVSYVGLGFVNVTPPPKAVLGRWEIVNNVVNDGHLEMFIAGDGNGLTIFGNVSNSVTAYRQRKPLMAIGKWTNVLVEQNSDLVLGREALRYHGIGPISAQKNKFTGAKDELLWS